nr:MAG TPA: hypothetical protein [Caudoviricetes sp.]
MTGYIKITGTTRNGHEGLEVQTDVQNVSYMDLMQVLDALCRSFKVSLSDLELFVALKSRGILDKATTVETIQDEHSKGPGVAPFEQLLNIILGGDDK